MAEPDLTETQKAYNVASSDMFQLAAYGHHRYHPLVESLTDEGKRQERDYNDRLMAARDALQAALLRLLAEHAETYRGSITPEWLRALADDPGALSSLAVRPDERDFDTQPATPAPHPPRNTWTFEGEYAAGKWHGMGNSYPGDCFDDAYDRALAAFKQRAETDKEHLRLRMLRADTVYTVVAEHDPEEDD
jgi:hypothetical protein